MLLNYWNFHAPAVSFIYYFCDLKYIKKCLKSVLPLVLDPTCCKEYVGCPWNHCRNCSLLQKISYFLGCGVLSCSGHPVINVILRKWNSLDDTGTDPAGYRCKGSDTLHHSLAFSISTIRFNSTIVTFCPQSLWVTYEFYNKKLLFYYSTFTD